MIDNEDTAADTANADTKTYRINHSNTAAAQSKRFYRIVIP